MEYFENVKIEDKKFINDLIKNREYIDCEFINCNFVDTDVNNCVFKDCSFYNCTINNVRFKHTIMKSSTLIKSAFIGVNWSMLTDDSIFVGPIYSVEECFFKYNNFISLKLNKMDFSSSRFTDCLFQNCAMVEMKFKESLFEKTQFIQCDLTKADFRNAHGYSIDINANKLKKAKFSFPEVVNLLNSLDIIID